MARTLGTLTIDLVLQLAGFKQGMDRAARETERGVKKIESSFKGLQRNISLLRRGLGALGVGIGFREIIQATAEAEKSFALLENAVENNAGAAGKTARELADLATELQHVSTFSDEAIQDAERLLLTFQSIRGDNFDRATQAVLDLATALGKDLPSAALLVGKALEDPVKGMTQLARAGVVLSPIQQKLVKDFTNAGDAASAQGVILDELNEKYKGTAAAARDNFGGALQGLKNDFDNLLEAKSGLPGATDAVNSLAKAMQDPAFASGADAIVSALLRIGTTAVQAFAGAGQGLVTLADHFTTLKILATQGIDFPVTLSTEEIEEELKRLEARLELQKKTSRLLIPTALEKLETAEIERRIAELRKQKVTIAVEFQSLGGTLGFDEPVAKSLSKDRLAELDRILEASKDTSEKVKEQIDILNEALATGLFPGIEGLREYAKAYAHVQEQLNKPLKKPELSEHAKAAQSAREAITALIAEFEQQAVVTGQSEEATIAYRIAFGDLVDEFDKAGPKFEERKQQLLDAAAAFDQFKAGEELRKANEAIAQQVIDLQAQRIALDDGAAAAFRFSAQHGELAKTLDLATDSQAEFTDAVEEGANVRANLELQTAITTIDGLIRSTEEATQAIIANAIAEEQGAVAAIRYRIAQGDLKDEFEDLGAAAGEWQKRLEDAAAAQEVLTQRQAEDAASESIIPSRTKALKEYDDAIAGLNRRLAEGEISQRDFDQAVKIAEKNFKEATKAIDEMSVFAEEAARNMQSAFADFLFDPFEDGLEGMLSGFADTLRRMAAEIVAAQLAEKFNFEDIFKGGGIFGGGGGGTFGSGPQAGGAIGLASLAGFNPRAVGPIQAPSSSVLGTLGAAGDVAGESAAAAAFTAAGTAAAAALTTAGTTTAAALTTAGTTAATALGTTGTTVASAIIAAGTTAAAAIGAAATAGSAAGGLSEIVITAARLAEGGKVFGPGTAKSDSVPAMLSAGEFVVKAEAVRQPGVERLLTQINNHQTVVRGFATGGRVAASVGVQAPWSPGSRTDERHRTFDAHTTRTALQDVHRLLLNERRSTVERLLQWVTGPAAAKAVQAAEQAVPSALRSLAKVIHIDEDETQALTRTIARTLNERFDTTRHYAHADVLREELERWSVRREGTDVRRDVRDHRSDDIERLSHLIDRSESARSQFDAETHRTARTEDHATVRRAETLVDTTQRVRNDLEQTFSRTLNEIGRSAPIVVDLRKHDSAPLGDLRRSPDDLERLLARLVPLHRAEGGKVLGPGTGTSDSIPAWLSAGEFVVKAEAVRQPGVQKLLERLNSTTSVFRSFASGGYVYSPYVWNRTEQHFATGGLVQASAMPTANAAPTIINQAITVNAPSGHVSRATEMQLTAAAARGAKAADRHNN